MSFSVPRCSRPICGSQRSTISPSISTTRRSTPWAAGCCGPKFIVSVLISTSDMTLTLCLLVGLLVTGQHLVRAFPRAQEVETAELLRQPHRLVDDTLLQVVPAQLDEAGQRKILAQRMTLETVVGEDAAQVGMVGEPHAIEVVGLALEPAGRAEQGRGRRHRRGLVSRDLDADALVVLEAEQIVDDVEALLALGPIDAADVDELLEQAARIVAQESEERDDPVRRRLEHQLAQA